MNYAKSRPMGILELGWWEKWVLPMEATDVFLRMRERTYICQNFFLLLSTFNYLFWQGFDLTKENQQTLFVKNTNNSHKKESLNVLRFFFSFFFWNLKLFKSKLVQVPYISRWNHWLWNHFEIHTTKHVTVV